MALFRRFLQLQTRRGPPGQHAAPVPPLCQGEACEPQSEEQDDSQGAGESGGKVEVYDAPRCILDRTLIEIPIGLHHLSCF